MLVIASYAIASLVEETQLNEDYVIPKVNDPRILPIVTQTLKKAIRSQSPNGDAENRELHDLSDAISQEY